MLKMKKMNGLKIFTLVLLSLSKFETMFGMKKDEIEDIFNDDYVNENYYLIDDFGNKITLDNGDDIKFKICSQAEINVLKHDIKDILKISEENSNKILVGLGFNEEGKEVCGPILYKNMEVITRYTNDQLRIVFSGFTEEGKKEYENKIIPCYIAKKIGEESINNDYILVDTKNNKIEIKGKNIVFKLLTRKKYLDLKKKLINPKNYLKNEINQYILNESQNPLFFEEVDNNLILYVKHLDKDNLCLASLDLRDLENPNPFIKDNYIKVHMAIKEGIDKVEAKKKEKEIEVDSSKCCCGIC